VDFAVFELIEVSVRRGVFLPPFLRISRSIWVNI
jgi:hypothetical protein